MKNGNRIDYYEVLQVSPRADVVTISHVFRHLAKRYHPDNLETGDREAFDQLTEAYDTVTNPEKRAAYDLAYEDAHNERLRLLDAAIGAGDLEYDKVVQERLLSVLYEKRRRDVHEAAIGEIHLEQLIGCPREYIAYSVWYLKNKNWLERTDRGPAITALGCDEVTAARAQARQGPKLLEESTLDDS